MIFVNIHGSCSKRPRVKGKRLKVKNKTVFSCQNCGYQSPKWLGRCPDCSSWNSFVEETYTAPETGKKTTPLFFKGQPRLLRDVSVEDFKRIKTNIGEIDTVLGGGIVGGSVILLGGPPGIGKSTISLQICQGLTKEGVRVLYVSAEESEKQIKLRAKRLGAELGKDCLYIVSQTSLSLILEYIDKLNPKVVFIDSIQVMFTDELSSSPGSVGQVRQVAGRLAMLAKSRGISIFIIGHITKEGTIAGPRVLEHLVDCVLYFEGEGFSLYRILRAVKNRFGSVNEIGVFEMTSQGLKEIGNPSQVFLEEREHNVSGTVVTSILEGTRPLFVEIQALCSHAGFGYPSRRSQGFDYNRLNLLIAVLEKRIGLHLQNEDVFINVVGGIKIEDPAADLAVSLAIASAFSDQPVVDNSIIFGEVGLGGETRSVLQVGLRLKEAQRLGFKACILPKGNLKDSDNRGHRLDLISVGSLKEAMDVAVTKGSNK